jgi:hypothetical protein
MECGPDLARVTAISEEFAKSRIKSGATGVGAC